MVDNRSAGFYGIGGSFNFKSGDEVMIVRKHNENATHKTNLWKKDKDDPSNNIYKIGGNGNGAVQFKVIATPYKVSGQPLPAVVFTAIFGMFCVVGGFIATRKKNKKA